MPFTLKKKKKETIDDEHIVAAVEYDDNLPD